MSAFTVNTLYNLLPAIYRLRDQQEMGNALRALITVLAEQAGAMEEDIAQLYDNWFIETCEPWVAAYIGDLLDVHPLYPVTASTIDARAQVANTLAYRRRKGTATMLEQLAHDTTGWNARVVEFFQLLSTTQNLNHLRLENSRPDLRQMDELERVGTPFDTVPHTAQAGHISQGHSRYNLPNIGIFLWRLQPFQLVKASPCSHGAGRYGFSALGQDLPLYNCPQPEAEITHLAEGINVPESLRPRALFDELETRRQFLADAWEEHGQLPKQVEPQPGWYFGTQPPFEILLPNAAGEYQALPPEQILIADLGDWEPAPTEKKYHARMGTEVELQIQAAVDPRHGRFVLSNPTGATPLVTYAYAFSSAMGGGPYMRPALPPPGGVDALHGQLIRIGGAAEQDVILVGTMDEAIKQWCAAGKPHQVIQIDDNRTYSFRALTIELAGTDLTIQAGPDKRPLMIGDLDVSGGNETATLTLDGVILAGTITVSGDLAHLKLSHSTLVPGVSLTPDGLAQAPDRPSIQVQSGSDELEVVVDHSIVGPLRLPTATNRLVVTDSIVDSPHTPSLHVLVSGMLRGFPSLQSDRPQIRVTIAGEGPHTATFSAKPATLAQAREQLQAAVRAADTSPAFSGASVMTIADQLVIIPGVRGEVVVTAEGDDGTAAQLRLLPPAAHQAQAIIGEARSETVRLDAERPEIHVKMGRRESITVELERGEMTAAQACDKINQQFQGSHTGLEAGCLDNQIVILLDSRETSLRAIGSANDYRTVKLLGLQHEIPAIAADDTGAEPGPSAHIERSTVTGQVHLKELERAVDALFTESLHVERRQFGCVRFSYFPTGSYGPAGEKCQPALAIAQAKKQGENENDTRARVCPSFTDSRYGQPGYLQLAPDCPDEIRRGADNGAEMGAFNELLQPQREANLRASLDEYLRFGLEAGILLVN
jgi:hypothetical protein